MREALGVCCSVRAPVGPQLSNRSSQMRRFTGSVGILVGLAACSGSTPPAEDPPQASSGRKAGGKCAYEDTPGTGTVTAIEDDATAGADCKQAKKVTMSFVADDPAAKPASRDGSFSLEVGGVGFVATGCVEEHKIAVGTKLKVVRHVATAGTCSPIVYEVTDLSSPDAIERCVAHCR